MNKLYTLLLLAGLTTLSSLAQTKFDAPGLLVKDTYKANLLNPNNSDNLEGLAVSADALRGRSDARVSVFVVLNPGASAADVEARGLDVTTDLDDIVIASGSLEDILALEDCDFVKSLSFGQEARPLLNLARKGTYADDIHAGTNLSQPYKGKGVITGIYDTGVDPNHINFYDLSAGKNRVERVWAYTSATIGQARQYTGDAVLNFTTDDQGETHGTHTLGCMAGGYNEAGGQVATSSGSGALVSVKVSSTVRNPYYGMAPESTIAVGCGDLYSPNIVDGCKRIAEFAKSEGKPAVINLSIGGNIGPHDGSDAYSQSLQKIGEDAIIVFAAGNEGDINMSVDKTFTATDTEMVTFPADACRYLRADFWSDSSEPFEFTTIIYNTKTKEVLGEATLDYGKETTAVYRTTLATLPGFSDGYSSSTLRVVATTNQATNKRFNVYVTSDALSYKPSNSSGTIVLGFRIKGKAGQRVMGTIDGYDSSYNPLTFSNKGVAEFTDGSSVFSINEMSCFSNCIVVGAWNTRKTVPCIGTGNGAKYSYTGAGWNEKEIAGYSSHGILANGTRLPHVCAPGTGIVSSYSTYYYTANSSNANFVQSMTARQEANMRQNVWAAEQGTSMACPIVAGGIALWLQADPNLKVGDIKQILAETSYKDNKVTDGVEWGAGKFDALAGLKWAINHAAGVSDVTTDDRGIIITANGDAQWNIFVPGNAGVKASLYNLAGVAVASASTEGNELNFDASGLSHGIYILNVNGVQSHRVAIR